MDEEKMLTTKDVMTRLGVSRTTVLNLFRSGKLPVIRVTRRALRVEVAALDKFVAAARSKGDA